VAQELPYFAVMSDLTAQDDQDDLFGLGIANCPNCLIPFELAESSGAVSLVCSECGLVSL
jgi:hypothetical protein